MRPCSNGRAGMQQKLARMLRRADESRDAQYFRSGVILLS